MSSTGDRRVGRTDPGLYVRVLRRARVDRDGYVQDFIATYRAIGSRTYPPDPARLRAVGERCFERGIHPDGAARQLAAIIAAPDRTPMLRGLKTPATVIHGDQDRLVMPSGGRATAAAIPGAQLVIVVPGMAHHMPPALWPRVIDEIAANTSRATEPGERGLPVDEVSGGV